LQGIVNIWIKCPSVISYNIAILNHQQLLQICRSSIPTGIKYKFGIQVPKGIKNAINLDKKNGNNLWEEAIKTELKQLTDYQTFIVLDSGESIPNGYQNIP
jgi:hypothetical protein